MNRLPFSPRAILAPIVAAFLAAGIWAGCADERADLTTGPQAEAQRTPLGLSAQELGPALAAQAKYGARLMGIRGVVGHGIGLDEEGEPVVRVFTLERGVRGIPSRLDGVGVDVQVTGMFWAGSTTDKHRPAPNGVSVGHPDITAGTLGARVKATSGSNVYILSNNHVLAASNNASLGDPALQPGAFDGGTSADQIGTLHAFKHINFNGDDNVMDAAIAIVDEADVSGVTLPEGYGAPGTTVASPSVGLAVQKFGRTTGLTTGQVEEINATVTVCYAGFAIFCTQSATFVQQVTVTPGDFSSGGDSGSLIVTNDANANPVALLFAGSSTRTIGNPIGPVLNEFSIVMYPGEDNGGSPEPNSPPTASFTYSCTDLTCDFNGSGSSDPDGSIVSYAWDFGDGNTDTGVTASHIYGTGDTYTVTLTVTDDDGATDSDSQPVTVSEPSDPDPGDGITLSATGYKIRGVKHADLSWSGATGTNVEVYRDGNLIATTANDGAYTDNTGQRGGGSHTYLVCEEGTSTCSNEATVSF